MMDPPTTKNKRLAIPSGADGLRRYQLAAVTMRRKIVEMGYANHIRLHYGALMSMVEIMTALYLRNNFV